MPHFVALSEVPTMSKIYLTEAAKRDDEFRRTIAIGLAASGVGTQKALAAKMRVKPSTLSAKLKDPDRFRRDELRLMARILHIEPEAMARVL